MTNFATTFLILEKNKGMIFHKNRLPADKFASFDIKFTRQGLKKAC